MCSQKPDSTNDIISADDGSIRSPRTCPRLVDDNEVEDPGEQPSRGDGVRNGLATRSAFPRFMELPPELRHQIWHFYCPDLSVKARVLEFTFQESEPPSDGSDDYDLDFITAGFALASQTKSLRAMLSTHHESRSIAVRIYPDELALDMGSGRAIVRFRKESDVVLMNLVLEWMYIPPEFATQVQNLAIGRVWNYYDEDGGFFFNEEMVDLVPLLQGMFPNVKRLYNLWDVKADPTARVGHWCVTEYAHKYMFEIYDRKTGIEEDRRFLFCWPDLDAHPDYARSKSSQVEKLFHPEQEEEFGLETWSMLRFESEECFRVYDRMRRLYLNPHSANAGDDEDSPDSEVNDDNNLDEQLLGEIGHGHDDDDEDDDDDEQMISDGTTNAMNESATRGAFLRFMQLPSELRRHIWYFYCPDLSAKARVLEFTLKESDAPTTPSDHFSLKTDPTLASQTKSLRAMLSTHRESRSIAVRIYPDELTLDMGPDVRLSGFARSRTLSS